MGVVADRETPFDGVLVLSSLNEPCTGWVTRELEAQGVSFLLLNFEEALLSFRWSVSLDPLVPGTSMSLRRSNEPFSSFAPRSVWWRRWGHPIFPSTFDETSAAFAFGEVSSVVHALPEVFPSAKWVNAPTDERRASSKVYQLQLARQLGFKIPRTLVSSDADAVRRFKADVGRVIFKPASGYQPPIRRFNRAAQEKHADRHELELGFGKHGEIDLVFTQELTDERIALLEDIRWAPAIFQERIEKAADIRVTIVGTAVYSCRIFSQERAETVTDFRVMNLTGMLRHELVALPPSVENRLLAFMREVNLVFGCFDLIELPDGDYCFLEVNPAGQWLWVEQLTGAPISKAVARQLMDPVA